MRECECAHIQIHIIFVTVYCCKYLLVIILNLLLCLIYKLNFIIGVYV